MMAGHRKPGSFDAAVRAVVEKIGALGHPSMALPHSVRPKSGCTDDTSAAPTSALRAGEIRRVQQEHRWGCEIACAAMVRGVPYATVVADLADEQHALLVAGESPKFDLVSYLCEHGFGVTMRWPERDLRLDPAWKPEPRVPVSVYATSTTRDLADLPGGGLHAVVVLPDGTVIDPHNDPSPALSSLFVWHVVEIRSRIKVGRATHPPQADELKASAG